MVAWSTLHRSDLTVLARAAAMSGSIYGTRVSLHVATVDRNPLELGSALEPVLPVLVVGDVV